MMKHGLLHSAERKAFEIAVNQLDKKSGMDRTKAYSEFISAIQHVLKDGWSDAAYQGLRETFSDGGKWARFFDRVLDEVDFDYFKGIMMSVGYEGAFRGFRETRRKSKELDIGIPWIILFDPTSACNLHCTGCWASEYERQSNLSFDEMDSIVTQGKALGIHMYVMTGGEPLTRKNDIVALAEKHNDCGFMLFTNGTIVDQKFCNDMKRYANIILSISIEGDEAATDARRGAGIFTKVMSAMDLLKENRIAYGTSICYTSNNYMAVTSDAFYDFLIKKGVRFSWYFHFMPVGVDSTLDLMPTPEQREYMYHRLREVRGFTGGKEIFVMDFQNDGEFVGGCIAGGKFYCHINPNGDVEPCVFVHYSSANIRRQPLEECLKQPLFKAYQQAQPFNDNLLMPCPMLENPTQLRRLIERSHALSTDMVAPESCEHLCAKCDHYAEEWGTVAQKLWESSHNVEG